MLNISKLLNCFSQEIFFKYFFTVISSLFQIHLLVLLKLPSISSLDRLSLFPPFHWVPIPAPHGTDLSLSSSTQDSAVVRTRKSSPDPFQSHFPSGVPYESRRKEFTRANLVHRFEGTTNPILNKQVIVSNLSDDDRSQRISLSKGVSKVNQNRPNFSHFQRGGHVDTNFSRLFSDQAVEPATLVFMSQFGTGQLFETIGVHKEKGDSRKQSSLQNDDKTFSKFSTPTLTGVRHLSERTEITSGDRLITKSSGVDESKSVVNVKNKPATIVKLRGFAFNFNNRGFLPLTGEYTNKRHFRQPDQDKIHTRLKPVRISRLISGNKPASLQNLNLKNHNKCLHSLHSWVCTHTDSHQREPTKVLQQNHKTSTPRFPILSPLPSEKSKLGKSVTRNQFPLSLTTETPIVSQIPNWNQNNAVKGIQLSSSKIISKCRYPFLTPLCQMTTEKPNGKSLLPVPSFDLPMNQVSVTKANAPSNKSSMVFYNKCSHSFHGWLCSPNIQSIRTSTSRSTSSVPNSNNRTQFKKPKSSDQIDTQQSASVTNPTTESPVVATTIPITTRRGDFNILQLPSTTPKSVSTPSTNSNKGKSLLSPQPSTSRPKMNKTYDKCSHSFHSWLCQKPVRHRLSSLAVPSNLRKPPNPPIKQTLPSTPLSTSPKPPTTLLNRIVTPVQSKLPPSLDPIQVVEQEKPSNTVTELTEEPPIIDTRQNICSHSLHAWKCLPSTTERPTEEKVNRGKQLINTDNFNNPSTETKPSPTKVKKPDSLEPWDKTDPCFHAFHSWLCKPNHRRLTQDFVLKNLPKNRQDEKEVQKSLFLFKQAPSSTARPPKITIQTSTTESPKKGKSFDTSPTTMSPPSDEPIPISDFPIPMMKKDPCTHSFHSYLCQTSPLVNLFSRPKPVEVIESKPSFGKSLDSPPSSESPPSAGIFMPGIPSTTPSILMTSEMPPKYDKCSHPFHSWLCEAAKRTKINKKTPTTAIGSDVDSDRFLLKAVNLPNIRSLPLDTDDAYLEEYFAPSSQFIRKLRVQNSKSDRQFSFGESSKKETVAFIEPVEVHAQGSDDSTSPKINSRIVSASVLSSTDTKSEDTPRTILSQPVQTSDIENDNLRFQREVDPKILIPKMRDYLNPTDVMVNSDSFVDDSVLKTYKASTVRNLKYEPLKTDSKNLTKPFKFKIPGYVAPKSKVTTKTASYSGRGNESISVEFKFGTEENYNIRNYSEEVYDTILSDQSKTSKAIQFVSLKVGSPITNNHELSEKSKGVVPTPVKGTIPVRITSKDIFLPSLQLPVRTHEFEDTIFGARRRPQNPEQHLSSLIIQDTKPFEESSPFTFFGEQNRQMQGFQLPKSLIPPPLPTSRRHDSSSSSVYFTPLFRRESHHYSKNFRIGEQTAPFVSNYGNRRPFKGSKNINRKNFFGNRRSSLKEVSKNIRQRRPKLKFSNSNSRYRRKTYGS